MTIFFILYFLGFIFHGYCAYKEITWCDKNHHKVTLLEHITGMVRLVLWPLVPIDILFDYYRDRLSFYGQSQSPNR